MKILNWELLSHPLNWVTIFLMVFIAALAFHLILSATTGINPRGETAAAA